MTNQHRSGPNEPNGAEETPPTFVVPGEPGRGMTDEERTSELQQARDLGSASRSCMAIIVVLLIMALVLCVFLFWAFLIA